jgi:hypothetical protein
MQDLAHRRYTRRSDKVRPKVFPDMLDGIDPQEIDMEVVDHGIDPCVELLDDLWGLGVQVGHLRG